MENMFSKLKAPFPPEKISWRVGSTNKKAWEKDNSIQKKGIALAYIDARDVMERLDEVVHPARWQALYPHANGKTSCKIGIDVEENSDNLPNWVWKENGAGDSDVEAEKGAFSDAFKRAAVLWGIGRYLYDLGNTWVNLDDRWQIPESEKKAKLIPALSKVSSQEKPEPVYEPIPDEQGWDLWKLGEKIQRAQDGREVEDLLIDNAQFIEGLPVDYQNGLDQTVENKKAQLKNGITNPAPTLYRFHGVEQAIRWTMKSNKTIGDFKTLKALELWENEERSFINALDILKAEKYKKDGKSPKERLLDLLASKRSLLTDVNTLNTPIG